MPTPGAVKEKREDANRSKPICSEREKRLEVIVTAPSGGWHHPLALKLLEE
jgi:hypothetical protein